MWQHCTYKTFQEALMLHPSFEAAVYTAARAADVTLIVMRALAN
jgi:hypothetical protein